jgi:hypothetical protein
MKCTVVKVENPVSAYFFLLLLKQKRLQSGTKSIAYQFVWEKKTRRKARALKLLAQNRKIILKWNS